MISPPFGPLVCDHSTFTSCSTPGSSELQAARKKMDARIATLRQTETVKDDFKRLQEWFYSQRRHIKALRFLSILSILQSPILVNFSLPPTMLCQALP